MAVYFQLILRKYDIDIKHGESIATYKLSLEFVRLLLLDNATLENKRKWIDVKDAEAIY